MAQIYNKNGVILWQVCENLEFLLANATLDDKQKEHLNNINSLERQKIWVAARLIVHDFCNSTIRYKKSGAPYVENKKFNVSISHTQNTLAVMFTKPGEPCGIDIEEQSRNAERIARKFCDTQEIEIAKTVYPKNPELLIWCAKEALYKMSGIEGLEFKTQIKLQGATNNTLYCSVLEKPANCTFFELQNYIIVHTI